MLRLRCNGRLLPVARRVRLFSSSHMICAPPAVGATDSTVSAYAGVDLKLVDTPVLDLVAESGLYYFVTDNLTRLACYIGNHLVSLPTDTYSAIVATSYVVAVGSTVLLLLLFFVLRVSFHSLRRYLSRSDKDLGADAQWNFNRKYISPALWKAGVRPPIFTLRIHPPITALWKPRHLYYWLKRTLLALWLPIDQERVVGHIYIADMHTAPRRHLISDLTRLHPEIARQQTAAPEKPMSAKAHDRLQKERDLVAHLQQTMQELREFRRGKSFQKANQATQSVQSVEDKIDTTEQMK
eukprot:TRINITY_DN8862_c0_g1_i1.p1 TRINITY_DN8862_c0_g1~~TRINITY_DN8862_c0_g1_i1.p1  ORF type:complete len:296 (-),score=48.88 TRINITY_DN8862_c0_g1_i1:13-900(-)